MIEIDARALAAAVLSCSGVAALAVPPGSGRLSGEAVENRPSDMPRDAGARPDAAEGDSAAGRTDPLWLRHDERSVNVSIVAYYGPALLTVTEDIEAVARPLIGARRLIVTVEDVEGY